jgi:isobutyryl-CoA mutase
LGAMETAYQRSKIQDESLYYETLKHTGELPIMGVNTFLSPDGSPTLIPGEVIRSTETEKQYQIHMLAQLHKLHEEELKHMLHDLKHAAYTNQNIFAKIMEISKFCSIGQITKALYDVGGQYRRNM